MTSSWWWLQVLCERTLALWPSNQSCPQPWWSRPFGFGQDIRWRILLALKNNLFLYFVKLKFVPLFIFDSLVCLWYYCCNRLRCSQRSRDLEFGARSSFGYFAFCLTGSQDKSKIVFPHPSPVTCSRWRLINPSPVLFSIVLCHPTPYSRPEEFRLVFTELAAATLGVGQFRRSSFIHFVRFVLPRGELFWLCVLASRISKQSIVLFRELLYFF